MSEQASQLQHYSFRPAKSPSKRPRVCLLSQRGLTHALSYCCGFEFEDVIAAVDDVDLIAPAETRASRFGMRARNRLSRSTSLYRCIPSGLRSEMPHATYDLFFALAQTPRDLLTVDAIRGWRRRCGTAICFIAEIWNTDVDLLGPQLDVLKQFDHVYSGCASTVKRLSQRLQREVEYLPWAVDAIRFCPDPHSDRRGIDICSIGRSSPEAHAALLEHARATGALYLFDSLAGLRVAKLHQEHRFLLASVIRNSRYFVVRRAKFNRTFETGDQEELGFRYFEGLAGGAVLIGESPRVPIFESVLGWEDSVISVELDSVDLAEFFAGLEARPERLAAIRRRNVRHSLQRNDWLYRWATVLERAGMPAGPKMERRERDLAALAELFGDSDTEPRAFGRTGTAAIANT